MQTYRKNIDMDGEPPIERKIFYLSKYTLNPLVLLAFFTSGGTACCLTSPLDLVFYTDRWPMLVSLKEVKMSRVSRRDLMGAALGTALAAGAAGGSARAAGSPKDGTRYIAAYDTESPACLRACRRIVDVHKRLHVPATFFITGKTLEANAKEYRELLDDPLFEVASHTWSHKLLRDHTLCGRAVSANEKREEICRSKELIERVFEKACVGLRPAVGFDNALKGAADVLALVREAGYRYVSSLLWGPDCSMPALIEEPFHYGADGFADLWELPGHGWHENLLKNHNRWGSRRLTLWPAPMPEAIPARFVRTPQEEFEINRIFLEKALAANKPHVSLIWHPWSLFSFDPDMKVLELTFAHARRLGLIPSTYADLFRQVTTGVTKENRP